ncbi:hypothetical protein HMPREF9104_03211 [Lentilactobacillus kisonensis F0435]|uniref:Uncharacterized protein n=1 Tax=Lentilactobacillus kisonensis F0435 TaxID=797516 RepID=H1LKQ7_9LACO|nr:hypothetical protein HMPREF9104_03211 [Lentilactobacillus kisonensis F0435]
MVIDHFWAFLITQLKRFCPNLTRKPLGQDRPSYFPNHALKTGLS